MKGYKHPTKFALHPINLKPTPCAPRLGKPPAFGKDPSSGLFAGDGARAPFGCPQV